MVIISPLRAVILCFALIGCVCLLWLSNLDAESARSIKLLSVEDDDDKDKAGLNEVFLWDPDALNDVFAPQPTCEQDTLLLIVVTSKPQHFERRHAVRSAWGGWNETAVKSLLPLICAKGACKNRPKHLWKTVFLVGQTQNSYLDDLVERESITYGDVLMGNYVDTYRNLTLKVVHGLSFAANKCKPRFVLKTDDDCFVNIFVLSRMLLRATSHQELYVGKLQTELHVLRDQRSKWYVSESDYSRVEYPPYITGSGYVLSSTTLRAFAEECGRVKPFPIEDAFVGVVMERVGVLPTHSGRFTLLGHSWHWCNFLYLTVLHRIQASEQMQYLNNTLVGYSRCYKQREITAWD